MNAISNEHHPTMTLKKTRHRRSAVLRNIARKNCGSRRKVRGNFSYESLEPRQLLAAGLLVNGDFESGEEFQGLQVDSQVAGWNAFPDENGERILDVVPMAIGNALRVDTQSGRFDRIYQDVNTTIGQTYILKFDIFGVGNGQDRSDEVRVFWDGDFAGVSRGIGAWQSVALELTGTRNDLTQLEFREAFDDAGGDGVGPFIDNISLTPVSSHPFENGSFEQGERSPDTAHTHISDIPGWYTDGPPLQRSASIRKHGVTSSKGDYYWNLETENRYDRLIHAVETEADKNYVLTFEMRSPLSTTDTGNQLRVLWNGKWTATSIPSKIWQTFAVDLKGEKNGTSWLDLREAFRSSSDLGDEQGPWIDNFRLYEIDDAFTQLSFDLNGDDEGEAFTTVFTGETLDIGLVAESATINAAPGTVISSLSVSIANAFDRFDEILSADTTDTDIEATYDDATNILMLEGPDTVENFEHVLKNIRYTNLSLAPNDTPRIIEFVESSSKLVPAFVTIRTVMGVDSDGDGITDVAETEFYNTDPNKFDTEGDLLPDGIEIRTPGISPLVADSIYADLDQDGLNNLDEVIHGSRLGHSDSDRDGTSDGEEVAQGSNPNDSSDMGNVDQDDILKLKLTVGDFSYSRSERYNLIVGGIRHQSVGFGDVSTGTYTFKRGQVYEIKMVHTGSAFQTPDFDYVSEIVAEDGTQLLIEDPEGFLGVHVESRYFFAAGKTAKLYIPPLDPPGDLLFAGLAEDEEEADGQFVDLNIDDDDRDGKLDREDFDGVVDEDDFVELTVTTEKIDGFDGSFRLFFPDSEVRVWRDSHRNVEVTSDITEFNDPMSVVYVEGVAEAEEFISMYFVTGGSGRLEVDKVRVVIAGSILVAIDGTRSKANSQEPNFEIKLPDETIRTQSHVQNFYDDYFGIKKFWHGPDELSLPADEMKQTHAEALNWIYQKLAENPNRRIDFVGFSRGGYMVMEIARDLFSKGKAVRFMGLFDPVDSTYDYGDAQSVSANVETAAVIFAAGTSDEVDEKPKYDWDKKIFVEFRSRSYFDRVDAGPDTNDTDYRMKWIFGTHSAIGGEPWGGDFPAGHTESNDRIKAVQSDQHIRIFARTKKLPINTVDDYGYDYLD